MKKFLTVLMLLVGIFSGTIDARLNDWKLTAGDSLANNGYGVSVAIDDDVAVVGASQTTMPGGAGAAYIYRFSGGAWSQEQKLSGSDAAIGDRFGQSVAMESPWIVVGAPRQNGSTGAVYIFRFEAGGGWAQKAKLTSGDGTSGDQFGVSVSISGENVIIGASGKNNGTGAAYIFSYTEASGWTQQEKITAGDGQMQDNFGAVAISGEYAIIGAPGRDEIDLNTGAAYLFRRTGESWSEQQKLIAGNGGRGDMFGGAVSIDGDLVLVGAQAHKNDLSLEVGAAYLFRNDGGNWIQEKNFVNSSGSIRDLFGMSVSVAENVVVIGAMHDDANGIDDGAAYIFMWDGIDWTQVQRITSGDDPGSDQFGTAVSINGEKVIVGAPGQFDAIGQAHVITGFEPVVLVTGDANGDGAVNVLDMLAIANNIMGTAPLDEDHLILADCNGDGNVNVLDMISIANVIIGVFEECPGAESKIVITPGVMDLFRQLSFSLDPEAFEHIMALLRDVQMPDKFTLEQNYPNPFNSETAISYQLSAVGEQTSDHWPLVTLKIYNLLGQEVRTVVEQQQEPGQYTVTWDGRNVFGDEVASGIYCYRLQSGNYQMARRMVLMK